MKTDLELQRAVLDELRRKLGEVPSGAIKITISNGWVRLEGEVERSYQKDIIVEALQSLKGVVAVTNVLVVKPVVSPAEVQAKIREALTQHAERDAQRIQVEVEGSKVILRGSVHAWVEREEATKAARTAPGVSQVDDYLTISP